MTKSHLSSKKEVLSHFKISSATLDNWIRISIPDALNNNSYDIQAISEFVNKHQKLNKRANKKSNSNKKVPSTLLAYLSTIDWIESYLAYIDDQSAETVGKELIYVVQAPFEWKGFNLFFGGHPSI